MTLTPATGRPLRVTVAVRGCGYVWPGATVWVPVPCRTMCSGAGGVVVGGVVVGGVVVGGVVVGGVVVGVVVGGGVVGGVVVGGEVVGGVVVVVVVVGAKIVSVPDALLSPYVDVPRYVAVIFDAPKLCRP